MEVRNLRVFDVVENLLFKKEQVKALMKTYDI